MIPRFSHKIGEPFKVVRAEQNDPTFLTVRQLYGDNFYLDFGSSTFVEDPVSVELEPLVDSDVVIYDFNGTFPVTVGDYLFEYTSGTDVEHEVHRVGNSAANVAQCVIYGTLLNLSGNPIPGQVVEAMLNRGYFPHKSGTAASRVSTVTDEAGYFELVLRPGLDVTIAIPSLGYVQRGLVPYLGSVELQAGTLTAV